MLPSWASRRRYAVFGGIAAISGILLAGLFLRLMNFELRRDEQLYVPPAKLLDDQALYRDFFYNHTPGSAWLFHAVRAALGCDNLLMDGRLGVALGWLVFATAIGAFGFALTRSLWVSWATAVLCLLNTLFLTQTGMAATNNFLPLPLSFCGLALLIVAVRRHEGPLWYLAAGAFLSLAVVFKLNAVAFIVPAAVAVLLLPEGLRFGRRVTRVVVPFALGGLIGGAPILYHLADDHALFLAHVVQYHLGPHAQYYSQLAAGGDDEAVLSTAGKLLLLGQAWLGSTVAFAVLALLLVLRIIQARRGAGFPVEDRGPLLLVLAAFGVGALISFIPTPSFAQYFAPPLICLPLGILLLAAGLHPQGREIAARMLAVAAAVVIALQSPRLAQQAGTILNPGQWAVTTTHESGVAMARELERSGLKGKVATLAPIYPLEGGLAVYPELATGLFAFRTADLTSPALARFYRMTSPTKVAALMDADPPAAFLLGFDDVLEKSLLDYALAHGYAPVAGFGFRDRYGEGVLYLKGGR